MGFPEVERVIYQSNPLDEVICQLRFPPILRIETEPPATFQERIRADYPFYAEKAGVKMPAGVPESFAAMVRAQVPGGGRKAHTFESSDRLWAISLHREALALTCRAYVRWEDFRAHLDGPHEALRACYGVPFFTRIGLRYRDVIRRSLLGLSDVSWGELLQPWISGVLGPGGVGEAVESTQSTCLIRLPDNIGFAQMSCGLATEQWQAEEGQSVQETVFVIDADLFTDNQTEAAHVFSCLAALNRQSGLLFRWCITDRLHRALQPEPVPGI